MKLPNSPAIMVSGISTKFLPSDPNELCKRLKLLLQERQAGNNCDIISEELVVILDNLPEYKCISKKQHLQIFIECNFLHTKKK